MIDSFQSIIHFALLYQAIGDVFFFLKNIFSSVFTPDNNNYGQISRPDWPLKCQLLCAIVQLDFPSVSSSG